MDKGIKNPILSQLSRSLKLKNGIFNCIFLRLMKRIFSLRERIDQKNDIISSLYQIISHLHLTNKKLENELQNYRK